MPLARCLAPLDLRLTHGTPRAEFLPGELLLGRRHQPGQRSRDPSLRQAVPLGRPARGRGGGDRDAACAASFASGLAGRAQGRRPTRSLPQRGLVSAHRRLHVGWDGNPRVWFTAKRDIEAGEELTFDYGEDYWLEGDNVV